MSFTEKERTMSHSERAKLDGYNSRYEGKTEKAMPAPFARDGALARAWRNGWHKADGELTTKKRFDHTYEPGAYGVCRRCGGEKH